MKVVINKCYGGFSLSEAAYEKLIEWGVPVRKYVPEERGDDGRYIHPPENEGEIIFDRELTPPGEDNFNDKMYHAFKGRGALFGRYWDTWTAKRRDHPLVVRVVEELGEAASGFVSNLQVVEIPDGVEYIVQEYDGQEWVAEAHRSWS